MKVFWSWQSDHPAKISRTVIRKALEEAIAHLKQTPNLVEAPDESRGEIHLDHDTKGVRGSPDIARTILEKIANSTVFVGDVTIVGKSPDKVGNEGTKPGRPLINSNVAIEYGYAMHKLGDNAIVGVMNEAFGKPENLPFDIIHKRWPIRYHLVEGATKAEIDKQRDHLMQQFITALKGYIDEPQLPAAPFPETPPQIGTAFYFKSAENLGFCNQIGEHMFMPFRDVLYMRLIPTAPLKRPVTEKAMLSNASKYGAMGNPGGVIPIVNQYGTMCFSPAGATNNIEALTQYFPNGEVWAINADVMRQGNRGNDKWYLVTAAEQAFMNALNAGIHYLTNVAMAEMPIKVIAGVVGMKGRTIAVNNAVVGTYGKMMTDSVELTMILRDGSREAQDQYLLQLYEKIFDQSGHARPQGLNGFPKT